uniref:Uncharacterized protein n=1 Tax=Bacteriophage sp. TaxID=38018 RepID=A0A8D9PEE8_9VIRU|nr:MAG TPA: hypothetical protein [Bacteriophage sp.]
MRCSPCSRGSNYPFSPPAHIISTNSSKVIYFTLLIILTGYRI